jgi:YfiR/HmsC-like
MVHRSIFVGLLAALLSAAASPRAVGEHAVNEYDMKAVYLYNLAMFVEWPAQAFKSANDPITICILGQSPIQIALAEAVNGESIDNRKLVVRLVSGVEQANQCQLLFIASSERKRLRSILQDPKIAGALTVGETEDFLAQGGAINFKREGNKVLLEINLDAVEQQKLRISSKLLNLARIVKK